MCGICGIFDFNSPAKKWDNSLKESITLLKNRGPNSNGSYFHHHVALGHTRLAVIDTSEIAGQPFTDNSGRYTIIFNGEFYNYREHKKNLEKKGYTFRSQSDTEVLLTLFIDKGVSFLNEINGCFSLSIYDNVEESLIIARDRYGIKPLVYYQDHEKLIFASEIKAILPFGIDRILNHDALRLFMYLNYIPAPHTIFQKMYKLLPGNYIKVKNGKIDTIPYYQINNSFDSNKIIHFNEATEQLRYLLDESVKRRLVSDVPLGTFLSGGIDSSIVTAIASKYKPGLKTFSVGFSDDPFYDETDAAKIIAEKFNTEHTVFSLSRNDLFNNLFDVLDSLDEPFADSSAIAVSALSRITKQFVTVALSGDGADELHAGYNKHYAHYKALNDPLFNFTAKISSPFWSLIPQSRNSSLSNKSRQALKYSKGLSMSDQERYWYWCSFADKKQVDRILVQPENSELAKNKNNLIKEINKNFNSILYTDMSLVLPNDMLFKVDMMSMSHGLEVRVPMLDHTIVDFMFTLPSDFKIDTSNRKKLLKEAFKDVLPDKIIAKPKHGFEIPLLPWLKNELQPQIHSLLNKSEINKAGILNFNEVEKLLQKIHSVNPSESAVHLWKIFVFQYWCKKYLN